MLNAPCSVSQAIWRVMGGQHRSGALGTTRPTSEGRWLVACVLVVVGLCLPLRAETLTVATYNIENYLAADRVVDGVYRENYPKPEEAKAALRNVIRALDAEVLALQEVGSEPYLEELRRDLASEGCAYPHAAWLEAADTARHVAVLSRRPLRSVVRHEDLSFAYFGAQERVKRGLLEVRIEVSSGTRAVAGAEGKTTAGPKETSTVRGERQDREITVFVVHLKSRFTDRPDDPQSAVRRAGEAVAVRDRVLKVFPVTTRTKEQEGKEGRASLGRFLIVGDCNDAPASRPLRALSARGQTRIAELLPAADSRGETWTHFYRKEDSYSRVDYILVSPALKPAVEGGAARIFDALPETRVASDHRPVVVRLRLE